MDNESSYNCSFLFSSLVDDHDPDSQDITFNKSEANSNSNSNSFNNTTHNQESRTRKKPPRNSDAHSNDGFNPANFFVKEAKFNQDDDFYISPAALNANTSLEDVLVTKSNIFNQPPDITELNEQCEIFKNDRGTVKLCIDGCLYIKNMKSGSTCYWQCVQKNMKNCHGCAVTYAVGEKHYLKRIRREHSHEPVVHNTRGFTKVYEMQLKNFMENLSNCRFTKNRWGNPKLVIDGYFYVRHSTKGQIFYWKCEQKGQCEAYVVTLKNPDGTHRMGRILREHTHKPKSENEIKELRLSYIPKFSQSHLDQIKKAATSGENGRDIPNIKRKIVNSNIQQIGQTTIRPIGGGKGADEGDSSSSMSLFSPNMPKLLTLKSSCEQDDDQFESDSSQTTSQLTKKTKKVFSRQSSQTSISQGSVKSSNKSSTIKSQKTNKQKLQFKRIEVGEKCEFVFLIDGVFKMLLNGFAYEIADGSEGKSTAIWKCSGHNKIFVECSATAHTAVFEGDHYLKGTKGKHNHPPCDEDVDDEEDDDDVEMEYDEQEQNFDEQDECMVDSELVDDASSDKFNDLNARDDDQNDSNSMEENNTEDNNGKNVATDTTATKPTEDHNDKNEFAATKPALPKLTREGFYYVENSVGKNRTEITYWKCEPKEDNGKCEFIVTKRGLPKLTREGYYYVRNSVNKNRAEITYWKCELKGRCTGTLVTETQSDGYYVKSSKEHNHPPDPTKYAEPRFDKPDEVTLHFDETEPQINEDSSEEILIIPDDDLNLNNKPKPTVKPQDPLAGDTNKNAVKSLKTTAKFPDIKLDLITTARGMPKIARNGYYYCKSSVNKNRQEITYWKCELKGQCKGFLISITKNDGYYFKSERTHCHPPDLEKYRSVRKSSFEELNNSFGTTFSQNSRRKDNSGGNFNFNRKPIINTYSSSQSRDFDGNTNNSFNKRNHIKSETSIHNYDDDNFTAIDDANERTLHSESKNFNRNGNDLEDLPLVPEGGDPSMTYECEFIISCQGNPKLCLNGYMYTKNRDKNTNFYWNCEIKKSRRCVGYCVTEVRNGKHIVKKIRAHNHKPDLRREMLSKKLSNILQKVYAKPLWNPRKIIDVELARLPDEIRRQLPKAYSIQRMVKRKVQEKVSTVRQSLTNGGYAPIPNMEPSPSTSRQPQQSNRFSTSQQSRSHYAGNIHSTQPLYNDEYNFNNLYNSNRRLNSSNNFYQQQQTDEQHDDFNERYDQSGDYDTNNQMGMNYNDPNRFHGSSNNYNQFQEQYGNDDVYNCEIKNEPIDDYGYQHFDGDMDDQMDSTYDNNINYNEGMDGDSWNNGSAFPNSYSNDEAYGNYENNFVDDNPGTSSNHNSNAESSNSSENSESSQHSDEYQNKIKEKEVQSPIQKDEINKQSVTTNVVYKKNQIAKKRIRAPDKFNN